MKKFFNKVLDSITHGIRPGLLSSNHQKAAILQSSAAGRKAGQLFNQLEHDCANLSKRTGIDKNELMDKTINLAKTTTLNFDEAFRSIERIVLEYTRENCIKINKRP